MNDDRNIRIERYSGDALKQYVPELARLRIEVFHDFPYLYQGDMDYEQKYLKTYIDCPEAVIVLAFDSDKVIGASTAIPMKYESDEFKQPFIEHGYDIDRVFYCGESVLDENYRGLGIGVRYFDEREAHGRELGGFDICTFCAVQRPEDHPLRPDGYVPLDRFWQKRGYSRHPELTTEYVWQDRDQPDETAKTMMFWLKEVTW